MSYSVVWFKRDLRLQDNEALTKALMQGPVLCLYILEPSYWAGNDTSQRQLDFLKESLLDLAKQLKFFHLSLTLRTGEVTQVLSSIYKVKPFISIYSHQETGNYLTFQRDIEVKKWLSHAQIPWYEFRQHGVIRGRQARNNWSAMWNTLMTQSQYLVDQALVDPEMQHSLQTTFASESWPKDVSWPSNQVPCKDRQRGGRTRALEILSSFLEDRSSRYVGSISSPLKATTACSRLSPYLSLGCVSMREVVQLTQEKIAELSSSKSYQARGLHNFISRLYWHCHFIQKLETEPQIEWQNINSGFNGMRENDWSQERFERLINAQTGWPLVDACVVMLRETGWLNFRMRAMLISVASYPLWLHWREVGHWLAQQFVDYEPGIHWSQVQMQSGTTGINTTRVYNPIKQAMDHDPSGVFVRRWLPVLRRVPDTWIFEPWKMTPEIQAKCGVIIGVDWPEPIVDLQAATHLAKKRLHERKSSSVVKQFNAGIVNRLASKQRPKQSNQTRRDRGVELTDHNQLNFDF
jgi:deoxyribodipyrimidine photo-lyase